MRLFLCTTPKRWLSGTLTAGETFHECFDCGNVLIHVFGFLGEDFAEVPRRDVGRGQVIRPMLFCAHCFATRHGVAVRMETPVIHYED